VTGKTRSFYAVGKLTKAFGLRGELVVLPMTESMDRFKKLRRVYVGKNAEETGRFTVEYARVETRGVRVKFVEAPDRTSAESLVGSLLFVDEKQKIIPRKGSYFVHDVVGLSVVDEHNRPFGIVRDVLKLPAQDVYVIEHQGREWMMPAVREFVTSIDMETRKMKVRLIEGLVGQ
jgi:16S rRNA processing protein RimM